MICAVGINHHAPLAVRELVALRAERVADHLRQLQQHSGVDEAAILSTCNRTEIYSVANRQQDDSSMQKICEWFSQSAGQAVNPYLYQLQSAQAVGHLFRVTCGLDSQLLGESEITAQVKQFAAAARAAQAAGPVINRLMERALQVAKAVRSKTEIGRYALSYAGLAARSALNIFPSINELSVLLVGTGEMCRSAATVFGGRGAKRLAFAGRSLDKTEAVAQPFGAESLPMASLPHRLAEFDIVVSATASQVPIIGKGAVERALQTRHHKPMMFADLAIPRDLENEIQQLPDVFVYHLDQFAAMAQHSQQERQHAAAQAEIIINQHVADFCQWLQNRAQAAPIRAYRTAAEGIRGEELGAANARIARGEDAREVLAQFAHRLTRRLTHLPTTWLRENKTAPPPAASDSDDSDERKHLAEKIR